MLTVRENDITFSDSVSFTCPRVLTVQEKTASLFLTVCRLPVPECWQCWKNHIAFSDSVLSTCPRVLTVRKRSVSIFLTLCCLHVPKCWQWGKNGIRFSDSVLFTWVNGQCGKTVSLFLTVCCLPVPECWQCEKDRCPSSWGCQSLSSSDFSAVPSSLHKTIE